MPKQCLKAGILNPYKLGYLGNQPNRSQSAEWELTWWATATRGRARLVRNKPLRYIPYSLASTKEIIIRGVPPGCRNVWCKEMNRKAPAVNLFPLNYTRAATDVSVIFHKGTGRMHNPHRGCLESTQTIRDYYGRAGTVNKTAEPP
jgi:hypothetical protein